MAPTSDNGGPPCVPSTSLFQFWSISILCPEHLTFCSVHAKNRGFSWKVGLFPNNFGERRRRQLRGSSSVVVAWRRILLQRGWILLARRRRRCETHVVLRGFEALVCDGQNVEAEMGTKVHCTVNTTSYRRLCSCNTDPF